MARRRWAALTVALALTACGSPAATESTPASIDCGVQQCVALTFDDGPGRHTARLLDILKEKSAPATFFLIGEHVEQRPDLVARMVAEDHEVGNHTMHHSYLDRLPREQQHAEIADCNAAIEAAGGHTTLLRPPYMAYDDETAEIAGMPIVLWNADTRDWQHRDPAQSLQLALDESKAGSIVIMHDVYATSVDAVPGIIDGLRAKGLTLATVSQLLGTPPARHRVLRALSPPHSQVEVRRISFAAWAGRSLSAASASASVG